MRVVFRFVSAGLLLMMAAASAGAADLPGWVWGEIRYDSVKGTATGIDRVISVLFSDFQIGGDSGDETRIMHKRLGADFPIQREVAGAVTQLKVDFRGAFLHEGESSATAIVMIGGTEKRIDFPTANEEEDASFFFSLDTKERFAGGTSVPITVILVGRKKNSDDSFLFVLDSIDIAAATE